MDQRKTRIALLVCVVLFAAGCVFSLFFSRDDTEEWTHAEGGSIVLSEIMASNRTYPAPDGRYLDYIELHNLSGSPVDLSGYKLSDDLNSIGCTIPDGTVIEGYGYQVIWCDKDGDGEQIAAFGISRDGGETIYLYNSANVIADQREVPALEPNTVLIRVDEQSWETAAQGTPGFANTEAGYTQWLDSMGQGNVQVVISEVMTDNSCIGAVPMDWVELTNTGSTRAVLDGAYLSNDPSDPLKWQIPSLTLEPGARAVITCGGSHGSQDQAPFNLSRSGVTLILTGRFGNCLSTVKCPPLDTDHSWAMGENGSYAVTGYATPGFANSEAGYDAWMASIGAEKMTVAITEIQTSNRSAILSENGSLCDWVELTNTGSAPVTLDGAYLSDDPAERGKWQIPPLTLAPGERVVIPCVGTGAGTGEAAFGLPKSGCTVLLSGAQGNIIDQVTCPRLADDRSWALQENGSYTETDQPTPGYDNTEAGYLTWRDSQTPEGVLTIGEVMPSNDAYLVQSDGKYYDLVELVNTSGETIDLSDFCLSNDPEDLTMFPLPKRSLKPGGRVVIVCSANDSLVGSYIQAPFTLSREESWLYLTGADGRLCDYLRICNVPAGYSLGREEETGTLRYFTKPTPGNANGEGCVSIAQAPEVLTNDGVYDDAASVTVELRGEGVIYYTLDGSIPTAEDPVYIQPLVLTDPTTLRAVSAVEGKLSSSVTTASYILGQKHTLPVLSLSVDPDDMFGAGGIYSNNLHDRELGCHLALYEDGGGFSIDCGVELMGSAASDPAKKSLKITFRGCYGAGVLGYPLFGDEGIQVFDALYLSACDYEQTLFRDALVTQLAMDMGGNMPLQRYRYCVLYINGEYFGIYAIREPMDELYYAQREAVTEVDVTILEEPAPYASDLQNLAAFCESHDLTQQEHYDYVSAQLDVDGLIDWLILQGYSCNGDIGGNLRYFSDGSRWKQGLYDLDGAFYDHSGFANVFSGEEPYQFLTIASSLIRNEDFRESFLERLGEELEGTLGNDHVLGRIDEFAALLAPEIARERERWGGFVEQWEADVARIRTYLTRYDHEGLLVESLRASIGLTDEEAERYFGR